MPHKLLALDMDGTLLTSGKSVSPRTRAALRELANKGVAVAFCTGRCLRELLDYPAELPFVRYGVLASGAVAYDIASHRVLEVLPLQTDDILEAMRIAAAERVMVHVMAVGESVVRPHDVPNMALYGMGVYQSMFDSICTKENDLVSWVRAHPGEVVKVNFYHTSPESRDRTRTRIEGEGLLLELAGVEVTSLECSALGVSKGAGLASLARRLGIQMSEVVAVGDSDNDLAALCAAGMPVAMGNATPAIKEVSRLVVADNDHDGIAQLVDLLEWEPVAS